MVQERDALAVSAAQAQKLRARLLEEERDAVQEQYLSLKALRYAAAACGLAALAVAGTALYGRFSGNFLLASYDQSHKIMVPSVGLGLVLAAIAIVALALCRRTPYALVRSLGLIVILIAGLRLAEYAFGVDWGSSSLFLSPPLLPTAPEQTPSALPTAVGGFLSGAFLVQLGWRGPRALRFALASLVTIVGAAFLLGYVYGKPLLYGTRLIPIALPATISLTLVGIGMALVVAVQEAAVQRLMDIRRLGDRAELARQAAVVEAQRNQLQAIMANTPAALLFLDGRDLTTKWSNERYTRLLDGKYRGEDLTGLHLTDFIPSAEEEGVAQAIRQAATGQLVTLPEFEYRGFEGGVSYFNWMAVPVVRAGDGRGYDVLVMSTDVTEQVLARKRIEELARQANQRANELDTVLNAMPDGVIVYDPDGKAIRTNDAMRNLLQYTEAESELSLRERIARLDLRDEQGRPVGYDETPAVRALRGQAVTGHMLAIRPGTERESFALFSSVPLYDAKGEIVGAVITAADVTDLKRAQEALRRSEARLSRVQEMAHLGSWELDLIRNELTWSDEVYRIFGLQPRQFAATYEAFLERVHPDDRAFVDEAYLNSVRDGRDEYDLDHRVVRANTGEIRFVHERGEHIRDAQGKIIRSVGMVQDITESRRAEEELRAHRDHLEQLVAERTAQLEANQRRLRASAAELSIAEQRERQRLAAALHDEVAQTLGGIKLNLSLFLSTMASTGSAEQLAGIVAMVDEAIRQSRAIMTELSPPILQQQGLIEALRGWGQQIMEKHGLDVTVEVEGTMERPPHDVEATLFQVVKELLQNTLKHARATEARIDIKCGEARLDIQVSDNGVGFDPGSVETTEQGGFGLFSIRERLAYMGGDFQIDSAPGKGTRSSVSLPIPCVVSAAPYEQDESAPNRPQSPG